MKFALHYWNVKQTSSDTFQKNTANIVPIFGTAVLPTLAPKFWQRKLNIPKISANAIFYH